MQNFSPAVYFLIINGYWTKRQTLLHASSIDPLNSEKGGMIILWKVSLKAEKREGLSPKKQPFNKICTPGVGELSMGVGGWVGREDSVLAC